VADHLALRNGDSAEVEPLPSALLCTAPSGAMRRTASVPSDTVVHQTAERLFSRIDPTAESNVVDLVTRRLPHFYPAAVLKPLDRRLAATVVNHGRLYLQGERLGVGASILTSDYARAFNARTAMCRDPRRIAYVQIRSGLKNPLRLLDALCQHVRAPLSISEIRFRSTETLARRFIEGIRVFRVCTLIFDHVHHASAPVLRLLSDLMLASDPQYQVPIEPDEYDLGVPRLGFVFVSHVAPEVVFGNVPEALHLLEGEHAVLAPYRSADVTAEAIRQAGIGLDDLDLTALDDCLVAQVAHDLTQGLVDQLHPFLRLVDAVARRNGIRRPTLEVFMTALPFHRHLRECLLKRADPPLGGAGRNDLIARATALRDRHADPLRITHTGAPSDGEREDGPGTPRVARHRKLREIRLTRGRAEKERRAAVTRPHRRQDGE
jgi:hypothetical protein